MLTLPEVKTSVQILREAPGESYDQPEKIAETLHHLCRDSVMFRAGMENLIVLTFDVRLHLNSFEVICNGSPDTILIDLPSLFTNIMAKGARSFIIAHNHPSGDPTPSEADIRVTRDILRAAKVLKLKFDDHIVFIQRTISKSLRELGYFFD